MNLAIPCCKIRRRRARTPAAPRGDDAVVACYRAAGDARTGHPPLSPAKRDALQRRLTSEDDGPRDAGPGVVPHKRRGSSHPGAKGSKRSGTASTAPWGGGAGWRRRRRRAFSAAPIDANSRAASLARHRDDDASPDECRGCSRSTSADAFGDDGGAMPPPALLEVTRGGWDDEYEYWQDATGAAMAAMAAAGSSTGTILCR